MHISVHMLVTTFKEDITRAYTTILDIVTLSSTASSEVLGEVWTLLLARAGSVTVPSVNAAACPRSLWCGRNSGTLAPGSLRKVLRAVGATTGPCHDSSSGGRAGWAPPCPSLAPIPRPGDTASGQRPGQAPAPGVPASPVPALPGGERRSPGPLYLRLAGGRLCKAARARLLRKSPGGDGA